LLLLQIQAWYSQSSRLGARAPRVGIRCTSHQDGPLETILVHSQRLLKPVDEGLDEVGIA